MTHVRVPTVETVHYALAKSQPPDLLVHAQGLVPTSGWQNAVLSAWVYVTPPADGIQDFDMLAEPPQGIVLQVISKISAHTAIEQVDLANYWGPGLPLLGVRVHATHNSVETLFAQAEGTETRTL